MPGSVSDGILVPGPIAPTTNRGRAGVANSAATPFAMRMFSRLISSSLSPMPKSSRTICDALNVFVSTPSHPAAKNPR